jgi:PIN domain nuclease of toxin-antitoxin system
MDCLDWIKLALTAPSISLLQLTPEIAVLSTRLPADFHGDPADRIIVASARKSGAYIVTKDSKIVEYGKEKFVNIIQV